MHNHKALLQSFHQWQSSRLGEALKNAEQKALNAILPHFFGYYLLQVSIPEVRYDLSASPILRHFHVNHDDTFSHTNNVLHALSSELPVATNSIDVVLLPHVLEFIDDPHVILREACRVVIPEGYIIILCFNPYSLWGLQKTFKRARQQLPWLGDFIAANTIQNWLTAYDFEIVKRHAVFFRFASNSESILKEQSMLDTLGQRYWPQHGAVSVLFAKKKQFSVTPLRVRWQKRKAVSVKGISLQRRERD